ncbi:hypothetical protein [Streptomyces sp. CB01881]|uniref:hypothetical protein n=1 Tax=Streptomyces sp. CB01881 TaxID=2078691 RepID=UPI000CDBDE11|nr:hypothetical protein [Streptomyces sp. CB01881]AUY48111.1 hypothetical protein C2142_03060 [Streptomyces sp. CB01881]TYC76598.1 hypothetical protein EH183_03080 [Streptomyces sp. CB01881]
MVVPLLIVVSVVTARTAVTVLGADPGAAMVLSSLVALLVAVALTRRASHPDPYERPAPPVCFPFSPRCGRASRSPPGWHLPEDAPTPTGRTTWAALAVTGVGTLHRRRLTTAFHGGQAWPPPRRDSRPAAGRSRVDVVRPASSGRP